MHIKSVSKFVKAVADRALREIGGVFGVKGTKTPEDIERYARSLGAFNFTLLGIRRTDYILQRMNIKDVLDNDQRAMESVKNELPLGYNFQNINRPIIIDIAGCVLDGYHRLQAKVKSGDETIQAYVGIPNGDY